jgi:nuclear transport factor 2 (NTF2) superfamily protein
MSTNVLMPNPPAVIGPPFTPQTARLKVRLAEDAWNSRDPDRVALAYTEDSVWRNRNEFIEASINDVPILETDRKFFWPAPGTRPADHPGIPDVK